MIIKRGVIGLNDIVVNEVSAENAGVVTVTTAYVQIVSLNCGTVQAGDRIFFTVNTKYTKGATAGYINQRIAKDSGTAVIAFCNDLLEYYNNMRATANDTIYLISAPVAKVTTGGTLVIDIEANSAGSDSTIAAGDAQIYALIMRGAA